MKLLNSKLALHVVFWIVYTAIFTFVEGGYSSRFEIAFYMELGFLPFRLVVVYINYFYFLPKFLSSRNVGRYIIYTLLSIAIASFLHRSFMYFYLNGILFPNWDPGSFPVPYKLLQSAMIITSPLIFLMGLVVVQRWVSSERRAEQLESEKMKAELDYLRSQVNPHFFFNTLNTLYGLALAKSDKTPEVVMKLSELMSYVLYEADKGFVWLSNEIDQIERYIALEQIRYEDRFKVEMDISGDIDQFRIPPLLLLPFIENCFKHGVNKSSKDGWIAININVSAEKFEFSVKNKVFDNQPLSVNGNNGVGIMNVKRRLELLFPDRHTLKCEKLKDMYLVELVIKQVNEN
ncbi:MAG: histidine kinase [Fulvivirga sp.]|uniref:sensor histidine kinase n=1 Tax=Fulvivirga sp. TaxID=1931237 RepID=UPI0032EDF765